MITQEQINEVPQSSWYRYNLECEHYVYSRVRINTPKTFMQHFVLCKQCQTDEKIKPTTSVTVWKAIIRMEPASDSLVSHVLDGSKFIVPRRILRTDGVSPRGDAFIPSGNPFPYTTKDRGY